MDALVKARIVANYVAANWSLSAIPDVAPYPASSNVAAILVDAVFQAGLNYRTVVLPRVRSVARAFPGVTTLCELERALNTSAFRSALAWSHPEKPHRLRVLVRFLRARGLDSLGDIRRWICNSAHRVELLEVRGVGLKTVDYLCRLLGVPAIAVDRHAQKLLKLAGVVTRTYYEARRVLEFAADLLLLNRWTFDRVMWQTMSKA